MLTLRNISPKKWKVASLVAIILFGIFLRTYHFSDWLQFEIDQTYDTALVSQGLEQGISNLPLLGPTAGGGRALRLGPAFYYLEYLSARIFGNNPTGHAILVLLSSILSMPIFYLFCRRYFSYFLSTLLLLLYSSSLYMVIYGRFSWSPNVLPFFILLTFYALLKSVSEKEKRRNFWFLVMIASFSILTQIHFNAFFTIPPIIAIFLFFQRPHFPLKTWLAGVAIFFILYSPLALSDLKTNGENFEFFVKKLSKTQSGANSYLKSFKISARSVALENLLILTGQDEINGKRPDQVNINHFPGTFWDGPFFPILGAIIFLFSIYYLLRELIRQKEKNPDKRAFIFLVFLWFIFTFLYYLSLAHGKFQLYPRFFLMIAPLAFILFGLILKNIDSSENKNRRGLVFLIVFYFFILNVANIQRVFAAYENGLTAPLKLGTEDVFPNTNRLTMTQQLEVTSYIQSIYAKNHFPVYLQSLHEYEPVFWYHLEKLGVRYYAPIENNHVYFEGNYFNIYPSNQKKSPGHAFSLAEQKVFGSITVDHWLPKGDFITENRQDENTKKISAQTRDISAIYTWKKFFSKMP